MLALHVKGIVIFVRQFHLNYCWQRLNKLVDCHDVRIFEFLHLNIQNVVFIEQKEVFCLLFNKKYHAKNGPIKIFQLNLLPILFPRKNIIKFVQKHLHNVFWFNLNVVVLLVKIDDRFPFYEKLWKLIQTLHELVYFWIVVNYRRVNAQICETIAD